MLQINFEQIQNSSTVGIHHTRKVSELVNAKIFDLSSMGPGSSFLIKSLLHI